MITPFVSALAAVLSSQSTDKMPTIPSEIEVGYLTDTPVIDGALDDFASELAIHSFSQRREFGSPEVDPVTVTYRIGYTPTHFYLHIQTDADAVRHHRRGYVYGDGYKLLLALPGEAGVSNQYYEIGVSPTNREDRLAHENRILVYNHVSVYRPFGPNSSTAAAENAGGTGFEALIAWEDLPPYHPWLVEGLGFNLYFAKGFEQEDYGYFTNGYVVAPDEGIWDEEIAERAYVPLRFEAPGEAPVPLLAQPRRRHWMAGTTSLEIDIAAASLAAASAQPRALIGYPDAAPSTLRNEGEIAQANDMRVSVAFSAPMDSQMPGAKDLTIEVGDARTVTRVVEFPSIDFLRLKEDLAANAAGAPIAAQTTLEFKLEQIETALADLRAYETGEVILDLWTAFSAEYDVFLRGEDPYADRQGPYRRGFRSSVDNSLQPYTIKLPDNYDPSRAYPLLVFLHGSAVDDQGLLDQPRGNGDYIELAPYGRDKFRAYSSVLSQRDIVDAIEDVAANFSVDRSRIVMGGFSMGGYGALRSYYENPELYAGVAVFAGHPNLANEWIGGGHPNFLNEDQAARFSGKPVFIYHGLADEALSPALMEQTASVLERAGARVTMRFIEDRGHVYQDEETHSAFDDWLRAVPELQSTP